MLAPGIGWANHAVRQDSPDDSPPKIDEALYWTTDNGKHWRNITPPITPKEDLSDFFFLDAHHGWAIFERSEDETQTFGQAVKQRSGWLRASVTEEERSKLQLVLAATTDAGATWSKKSLTLPLQDYFLNENLSYLNSIDVNGIAFADPVHGWLQLSYWIGMHGHGSLLAVTSDGGKTWTKAINYPDPNFADMLLVTPIEGWVFGTVAPDGTPNSLFVTRDGTKTWQELSASLSEADSREKLPEILVRPPESLASDDCDVHGPPVFQDPKHGFFEVDCAHEARFRAPDAAHTTVLFATTDGGRTWKADRTLRNFAGSCNSSTVVDSVWLAPVQQHGHLVLLRVEAGATVDAGKDNGSNSDDSPLCGTRLSFVTPAQGWMLADNVLSSTTDGGRTWTTITPGAGQQVILKLDTGNRT